MSHRYGLRTLKASSALIGNLWLLLEAAVLSCSWRNEDSFESISLFLLVGTTLVELRGTEPAVPELGWWLLPPLTNDIDLGALGDAIEPLLVPPNYLIVLR